MTPDEEEAGWARVRERWTDPEAHRAWLAGFTDVEGLGRAGRRYRDALAAEPADPIAARWRDEVVRRATVQGLASLPRTPAAAEGAPRWVRRTLVAVASASLAAALLWAARVLLGLRGAP